MPFHTSHMSSCKFNHLSVFVCFYLSLFLSYFFHLHLSSLSLYYLLWFLFLLSFSLTFSFLISLFFPTFMLQERRIHSPCNSCILDEGHEGLNVTDNIYVYKDSSPFSSGHRLYLQSFFQHLSFFARKTSSIVHSCILMTKSFTCDLRWISNLISFSNKR